MGENQQEYLKKLWKFETWRGSNSLGENLFIWRYFLHGNEILGWRLHSIRRSDVKWLPPSFETMWTPLESKAQPLLNIEVFECASRSDAHEFLVRLLGDFSSPLIARRESAEFGDLVFSGPKDFAFLTARANVVSRIRSVGHPEVPVIEFARRIDRDLTSRAGEKEEGVVPTILEFRLASTNREVGVAAPLEISAKDPLERPLWYKFFSSTGEVMLEKGIPVYLPSAKGVQSIAVVVTNPNRGTASQELKYTI